MSRIMDSKRASVAAIRNAGNGESVGKREAMTEALVEIHDVLWPPKDPTDVAWDAARCERIAAILNMLEDEISE